MFTGEFKFDLNDALLQRWPLQYCNAYHTTNEPIEQWLPLTPIKNPRVLTVAASGDQPLMYAAHGATHIDTFDITVYACAVMDCKTTALQSMDYHEYHEMVPLLKQFNRLDPDDNATRNLMRVISKMPPRTRALMHGAVMRHLNRFNRHSGNAYAAFPTHPETFAQTREIVRAPFNFIWTDLLNLSHYITGKYDIINISNIFDHYMWNHAMPEQDIYNTITSLWPHISNGGYILATTADFAPMRTLKSLCMNISFPRAPLESLWQPIVIQKPR